MFKTGDKVKVISLDKTKNYFDVVDMEKFLGKIVTIRCVQIIQSIKDRLTGSL